MTPLGAELVEGLAGFWRARECRTAATLPGARFPGARHRWPRSWWRLRGRVVPSSPTSDAFLEAVGVVELCRYHRRHAQRDQSATVLGRELAEYAKQRQVGGGPRLVQPFFADGPASVMSQPGWWVCSTSVNIRALSRCAVSSRAHRDRHEVQAVVNVTFRRAEARNRRTGPQRRRPVGHRTTVRRPPRGLSGRR